MHILLIDDNAEFRAALSKLLREAGHSVRTGSDGAEAQLLLRSGPADLLITDIVMPEEDGLGLLLVVRREYPGLPVIAISDSGLRSDLYLDLASKLGAVATLTKPFSATELTSAIARVTAGRPGEPQGRPESSRP
jgi:CheY-like chemotaxis protein